MTLTQVQNILDWLGGTITGSTCYFYEMTVPSGSVNEHIIFGELWLQQTLGDGIWLSTNTVTSGSVQKLIRDYLSFRTLALLSGDIITDGFKYRSGQSIERPQLLPIVKNMMEVYRMEAELEVQRLQPISVVMDQDQPRYGRTAPPIL